MILSSQLFLFGCCAFLASSYGSSLDVQLQEQRNKRMFSLFNVVKFKNTNCQATSSADLQGVCMTKEECDDISGGSEDGNCAAGFGTCCVIKVSGTTSGTACDATVNQNCTFIESVDYPTSITAAGTCTYTINRCSTDICQVRLDFLTTVLAQPPLGTTTTTGGVCGNSAADGIVVTPGITQTGSLPVLCGTLTGQHMYIEADRSKDPAATVAITTTALNTQPSTKNWRIKVSQIECSSTMKAPQGCLQYFTGIKNTVTSFNFDGTTAYATGGELANQDYRACFRQEAGMCSQQFAESTLASGKDAFLLSRSASTATISGAVAANCLVSISDGSTACDGSNTNSCSFIIIPGGSLNPVTDKSNEDIFCGMFLSQQNGGTAATETSAITTTRTPFTLRHASLGSTGAANAILLAGFSLDVTQLPC